MQGSDQWTAFMALIVRSYYVDHDKGLIARPSPIEIGDTLVTVDSLEDVFSLDPAAAFVAVVVWKTFPTKGFVFFQTIWVILLMFMIFSRSVFNVLRRVLGLFLYVAKPMFVVMTFIFMGDLKSVDALGGVLLRFGFKLVLFPFYFFTAAPYRFVRFYVRAFIFILSIRIAAWWVYIRFHLRRNRGGVQRFMRSRNELLKLWTQSFMTLQDYIDDISLPEFIRSIPDRYDITSINESIDILESLGWPTADRVKEAESGHPWAFGNLSWNTGMRQTVTFMDRELEGLRKFAEPYIRTESYRTTFNEVKSLERYFNTPDYNFPDVPVAEVFSVVSDIFELSRLTPSQTILRKWVKKYALGPLWRDTSFKHPRKLKRSKAIKMMGGFNKFKSIWDETFKYTPIITPVAGVSVKDEALPLRKVVADVVRTVIGAPIGHYILSTIWNYQPNHNYKWQSSPIKIGIPINGANFSRLFAEHAVYDKHFAGDFSAFDSTITGKIVDIIKGVRKMGFRRHRDYARICHLIDINYNMLRRGPLATTSTGEIYFKGDGLTTGHSSTSMDNSVALVTIYLMAWRELTGLSASEFKYHCKLSNYGDDHILSWNNSAPPSWTPENIQRVCATWGLTLRDEAPSRKLHEMQFLSKGMRTPTFAERSLFKALNIQVPPFVVFHDPIKLVGKMAANVKSKDRDYRAKRLISYLLLTAHHPEIYDQVRVSIDKILKGRKPPVVIPTYNEVIMKWYDPKTHIIVKEVGIGYKDGDASTYLDDDTEEGLLLDYGLYETIETIANIVSLIPDVVNPAIFNAGYTDTLIRRALPLLSWIPELVRRQNAATSVGHLSKCLSITPYSFLGNDPEVLNSSSTFSTGGLLLKHWLFMAFVSNPSRWSLTAILNSTVRFISRLQFFMNAKIHLNSHSIGFPFWNFLVGIMIGLLPDIALPEILGKFTFPEVGTLVDQVIQVMMSWFWSTVPTNFKIVCASVKEHLSGGLPLVISAATGTGKSTALVATIWNAVRGDIDKLIVVEPRSILVKSTVPYMNRAYGLECTGATTGFILDPKKRVIYCTPQELLIHSEWHKANNLFIVDECHVDEPAVKAVITFITNKRFKHLLVSATPRLENFDGRLHHSLPIAKIWSVIDVPVPGVVPTTSNYNQVKNIYDAQVMSIVSATPYARFLIFVVDKSHSESLAHKMPGAVCVLNSTSAVVDPDARFYVSTSVTDVGVTIPGIDYVITMNIDRHVDAVGFGATSTEIVRLSQLTLTQRRGRTGRTNNGYFTVIDVPCPWVKDEIFRTPTQEARDLLASGVPAKLLSQLFPPATPLLVSSVGDAAIFYDQFLQSLDAIHTELAQGAGTLVLPNRDLTSSDPVYQTHFNLVAGGHKDAEGNYLPLTGRQMLDFTIWAAGWAASKGVVIKQSGFKTFMTTTYNVNPSTWEHYVNAVVKKEKWTNNAGVGTLFGMVDPMSSQYVRGTDWIGESTSTGISHTVRDKTFVRLHDTEFKGHNLPGTYEEELTDAKWQWT